MPHGSMMKSKSKSENTSRQRKMGTQLWKSMGYNKSSCNREVYSNTGLPQETRKTSNKQPNLPPKRIRKSKKQQGPKSAEGRK